MPSKNDLSSIKLKSNKTLETISVRSKTAWRRAKPPAEKCSEIVGLKFTPSEMETIKNQAGLIPLATYLKNKLNGHNNAP